MAISPDFTPVRAPPAWRQKLAAFWRWWAGEISRLVPERFSMLRGAARSPIVALDGDGRLTLTKVPSTPKDLLEGIAAAVQRVLALAGAPPEAAERFVHGTTVATNAVLEQKGAVRRVKKIGNAQLFEPAIDEIAGDCHESRPRPKGVEMRDAALQRRRGVDHFIGAFAGPLDVQVRDLRDQDRRGHGFPPR